jgi:hypothetical protein
MENTGNLLEALQHRTKASIKQECAYGRLLTNLTDEEAEAVKTAFKMAKDDNGMGRAKVYSFEWLSSVLNAHGHSMSPSTLSRHARGNCGCE